jgi:methyl-accepting chemotaxis protein
MAAEAPRVSKSITKQDYRDRFERFDNFITRGKSDKADGERVWERLNSSMPDIMSAFYESMLADPHLRKLLGDRANNTTGLKKAQMSHWEYVFKHEPDLEFEGQAARIGRAHARVGIEPEWVMAAFGRILCDAVPVLVAKNRFSLKAAESDIRCLISRLFLDMMMVHRSCEQSLQAQNAEKQQSERDLVQLRSTADTFGELNEIVMSMAGLTRNTASASQSSQSMSAAADQMVSSIQQIAQNGEDASKDARDANAAASDGLSRIAEVAGAVTDISRTSRDTAESLSSLSQAASQIGEFLTVIQSIADQTNLLALNATIEAARAGEAGKGFAVVASEVKALASQTGQATEDISKRIEALQQGMETIQHAIEQSQTAVSSGENAMASANENMNTISQMVASVSARVTDISSILRQQEDASQEIAKSVGHVSQLSQHNDTMLHDMQAVLKSSNDSFKDRAQALFQADSNRSLCEMARIDHVAFKKRVVDTVTGLDGWQSTAVPDHHNCRLGKWYDGISNPEMLKHPAFIALKDPHERVHAAAKTALSAYERGDSKAAHEGLQDMELASQEVLAGLQELSLALDDPNTALEKRKAMRVKKPGTVVVETRDNEFEATVVDTSRTGIRLSGTHLSEGQTVRVIIEDARRVGSVAWESNGEVGVEYFV